MQRSSIIATVIATAGILVAGSVASVAAINAASTSKPESQTLALVSTKASTAPSAPAPVSTPAPSSAAAPSALPPIQTPALPVVPEVTDEPVSLQSTAPRPSGSSPRSSSNDVNQPAASMSAGQARAVVMKQGDGVSVVATTRDTRKGNAVWAVRIRRSNGEVLTGFVDRASGVVIDWQVNSQPVPTSTSSASSDDSGDDNSGTSSDDANDDSEHSGGSHSGSDHSGGDDD